MSGAAVTAVDHVAVAAPPQLESRVTNFYSQTLGLEPLPKPTGTRLQGAWFQAGAAELHVTIEPEAAPGAGHFGLEVADFEAALDRLHAAGCRIEPASEIPGRTRCYTRDPAGNRIEIVCYQERASAQA